MEDPKVVIHRSPPKPVSKPGSVLTITSLVSCHVVQKMDPAGEDGGVGVGGHHSLFPLTHGLP